MINLKPKTIIQYLAILISILAVCKTALAQRLEVGNSTDTYISANQGKFIFNNLKLEIEDGFMSYLSGNLTNDTDRGWMDAKFEVILYDKKNEVIAKSRSPINIYKLAKGESQQIGDIGLNEKSLSLYFPFYDNVKKAKTYEIKFVGGTYDSDYSITMTKPISNQNLEFEDDNISLNWIFDESQLVFILRNKTENPIKVDWNQVSYIDVTGNAQKVIHEGVKYVNRNESQIPTVIPPTAKIQDIIFPTNNVSYVSGQYGGWREKPMFPEGEEAKMYEGKSFSVFMPLEVNGETKNYTFTFDITNVSH
jgi:hypothetical protein